MIYNSARETFLLLSGPKTTIIYKHRLLICDINTQEFFDVLKYVVMKHI